MGIHRKLVSFFVGGAVAILLCRVSFGAIGDNAPSIPATYVSTHPRLPFPPNSYLNTIWTNRAGGAAFIWTDATNWSSSAPGNRIQMRHLLLAYLAEKLNSGPNVAAFLAKIQGFSGLNGNWNLSTGSGYWDPALALAMAYDWINTDLGTSTMSSIRSSLYTMETGFETNFPGSSPYNDQFYISGFKQILPLTVALAIYPDDPTNSLPHLRWAMDMEINMLWPAWKDVICGKVCSASTGDTDSDHGGAWHEAWGDYAISRNEGVADWYMTETNSWALASGRGIVPFFFTDYPWLKNFGYWTMYAVRPDFTLEPTEPMGIPVFDGENFSATGYPSDTGLNPNLSSSIAEIYNDPTMRGWSRLINFYGHTPNGYEPSGWPYIVPDNSLNTTNQRSALATVRNFPGNGRLYVRTGWGENDTFCEFIYRDNFWSHPVQDAGAINCFNRGALTIRSGSYGPGSASDHFQAYALQAISQNVPLIYDANDLYNSETLLIDNNDGTTSNTPLPNDGGQRRVGSSLSNLGGNSLQSMTSAPADPAQRIRGYEFYHTGKLVAYANGTGNKYTFVAADITAAYNNLYSRNAHTASWLFNQANTSNRTFRVKQVVRQVTFVPQGTAMLVFIYDQIKAVSSTPTKKVVWHFINNPTISSNSYTVLRNDLVTARPYVDHSIQQWSQTHIGSAGLNNCATSPCTSSSTQYQMHGKLYGWLTAPTAANGGTLTVIGGSGNEFLITDANGSTNHNKCMQSLFLCTAGNGLGAVSGEVHPDPLSWPQQPGSYRLEETIAGDANAADQFINVQYFTSDLDTVTLGTPLSSLAGGQWTTTMSLTNANGTCNFTLVQPQVGIGAALTATGAGCAATI